MSHHSFPVRGRKPTAMPPLLTYPIAHLSDCSPIRARTCGLARILCSGPKTVATKWPEGQRETVGLVRDSLWKGLLASSWRSRAIDTRSVQAMNANERRNRKGDVRWVVFNIWKEGIDTSSFRRNPPSLLVQKDKCPPVREGKLWISGSACCETRT